MVRIYEGLKDKISRRFANLKISTKIMLFYFALLIFSVALSSILYQKIYSDIMYRKVNDVSIQMLYSINSNIISMIENANNLSKVIVSNVDIQEALKNSDAGQVGQSPENASGNQVTDRNYASPGTQKKIDSQVSTFIEAFPFISSIYIFDDSNRRYGVDKLLLRGLRIDNIKSAEWYGQAVEARGSYVLSLNAGGVFDQPSTEKYISLMRIVNDIYTQKNIGVLIINISENSFINSYSNITSQYDTDIVIIDEKNNYIVGGDSAKKHNIEKLLGKSGSEEFGSTIDRVGGTEYLISYLNASKFKWKIISIMPYKEVSKESSVFSLITFAIIAVNSFLLFIGTIFISRLITTPIKKLLNSMKDVEKGDFKRVDIKAGNDEIGKLRDGYNIMIGEIQNLINKVVDEQKIKRKAELDVLQAQIKPHFLYNTFDAISSLALLGKNEDVFQVMRALGSYYRTSLSKGSEVITIGEEIEVARNYLTIQKVRYGDIFSVEYNVDEQVIRHKILKLVLQPLVENSLYHGIKPKGEKGLIRITARHCREHITLTIEDDGVGMPAEAIERIFKSGPAGGKSSFGLKGTIERLRIFYGVEDIFSIESEEGRGTKIRIDIPVKEEDADVHGKA